MISVYERNWKWVQWSSIKGKRRAMIVCFRSFLIVFLFVACFGFSAPLPRGAGISLQEWRECEHFINTEADKMFSQGISYISPGANHPCGIEKDQNTGAVYIQLEGKEGAWLGEGGFKRVTKSILYGKKPHLVACCRGGPSLALEAKVLRKLRKSEGIVHMKGFIQRARDEYDMLLKYYNTGSLVDVHEGRLLITDNELLPVMRELIIGLRSLHACGYIHRDLHRGNILFTRKKGVLHAALTDFGLALKMNERPGANISVQNSVVSPEILLKSRRFINRKKAEAFSLGVLFYEMIFGERPSWCGSINVMGIKKLPLSERKKMFRAIKANYYAMVCLAAHKKGVREDLARLTYLLLKPEVHKRIYLDVAQEKIELIAKKWQCTF